jgi:hypothetical protein
MEVLLEVAEVPEEDVVVGQGAVGVRRLLAQGGLEVASYLPEMSHLLEAAHLLLLEVVMEAQEAEPDLVQLGVEDVDLDPNSR